jgi:hypothetical protein
MKTSLKVSIGGAVAALGLILLLMTGLIPFGLYAFPAFAGILLIMIVIEIGFSHAVAVFAATALLAFLLLADKEAALLYAVFLGWYPIVKGRIERITGRVVQYIVKLAVFNLCMVGYYYLATLVFSIPAESFVLFGVSLPLVFLAAGNVVFILYDLCVTRLVTLYLIKWHHRLNKNTKL